MERIAEKFKVKDGMLEEYKRRHDEIWEEMKDLMCECGIKNYTIWNVDNDLFAYFEVDDYNKCLSILGKSNVKKRWDEYMRDIIELEKDEEGQLKPLSLVFKFRTEND